MLPWQVSINLDQSSPFQKYGYNTSDLTEMSLELKQIPYVESPRKERACHAIGVQEIVVHKKEEKGGRQVSISFKCNVPTDPSDSTCSPRRVSPMHPSSPATLTCTCKVPSPLEGDYWSIGHLAGKPANQSAMEK